MRTGVDVTADVALCVAWFIIFDFRSDFDLNSSSLCVRSLDMHVCVVEWQ
jgi:hypothetical protein